LIRPDTFEGHAYIDVAYKIISKFRESSGWEMFMKDAGEHSKDLYYTKRKILFWKERAPHGFEITFASNRTIA
jgi:hypothetical protein